MNTAITQLLFMGFWKKPRFSKKIPTVLFFTLEKICLGPDFVMFQMKYFVNVGCKSMILVEGVDFKAW